MIVLDFKIKIIIIKILITINITVNIIVIIINRITIFIETINNSEKEGETIIPSHIILTIIDIFITFKYNSLIFYYYYFIK